ncbi:thioredoxin family protein [Luteolibacter sp. AS25]|uniref:thioredoxin family protein n=1 Tax=Luteolibacter sp. AS25 TaxID=3135776 RepID=UPI00398BB79F
MKRLLFSLLLLLPSCDHIDAVGDGVNELKDLRKESTEGIDGMNLDQILDGVKGGPTVQNLTEGHFQEFVGEPGKLNIVDFHAEWCPPCKRLGPVLSQVVEANSTVARLGKINVDQAKSLSGQIGVRNIPDVRFYIDGKMVHRFVGGQNRRAIENMIATYSRSLPNGAGGENQKGAVPGPKAASSAKPISQAMEPMKENWLPPGMTPRK